MAPQIRANPNRYCVQTTRDLQYPLSHQPPTTMDPSSEIEVEVELLPFVRIYKDGRVERLTGNDVVPAGVDAATGVVSKDVVISPSTGVSARLYLPDLSSSPSPTTTTKLPVLVYYHGGGFMIETAFSPLYHTYLNALAARARLLIVSLDYRRAPEQPLPAAYDDAWDALRWVAGGGGGDAWLAEYADLGRVFLAGDSAGGNIAHNVAVRAATEGAGAEIEGVVMVHPYFSGEKVEREEAMWRVICPGSTSGLDDPVISPKAAAVRGIGCRRVMVAVAEKDSLAGRGVLYFETLKGSGWGGDAELVVTEEEEHVFHLFRPTCDKAIGLMDRVVAFFSRG